MEQPYRVLQVVTTMNLGGLESFLMNVYRKIDRKKVQFDFLVHRKEEGVFDKEILSLGGRIFRLNPIHPKRFFQYSREIKSFFLSHPEYKVVHSHVNENSSLVLAAAKKAGVKLRIGHSHNSSTASNMKFLREILVKRVSKFTTHNLGCSVDAGNWLFNGEPFTVVNNGIDSNKFQYNSDQRSRIRALLEIDESAVVIGNVARFSTSKNHDFLIRIFAEYQKINPNSKLILIGEGDLKEKIQDEIKKLNISQSVIFTGAVQNANDYLSAMDLYLFPSLYEGLPLALVEAQCNGLPVLISDTISDDVILTNLVYKESLKLEAESWAKKIEEMLNFYKNDNKAKYSKNVIDKGYDSGENVKYLEKFYTELFEQI